MTCARTCVASSSCASCAALRGRASWTAMGAPKRGRRAGQHRDNPIRQQDRLLHAVGDHHGRDGTLGRRAEPHQVLLQRVAGERIERAEGFVEKQHFRVGGEGARNRHPLPHAARQLTGPAVERVRRGPPARARAAPEPLVPRAARVGYAASHGEADVFERGEPRQERVVLEDERRVAADAAHRLAVDDDAAAVGGGEAGQDAQQRRLSAAHRADDRDELATLHAERDVSQHRPDAGGAPGVPRGGEGLGDARTPR